MRTLDHKNIIIEKYNDNQKVIQMYNMLIRRKKAKGRDYSETQSKIDTIKKQLEMLQDKFPEYLI